MGLARDRFRTPSTAITRIAPWRRWADKVEEIALDCGHFVAEEEPDACAQALGTFFAAARPCAQPC